MESIEEVIDDGMVRNFFLRPIVEEFKWIIDCDHFEDYFNITSDLYNTQLFNSLAKSKSLEECEKSLNFVEKNFLATKKTKRMHIKWLHRCHLWIAKYFLILMQSNNNIAPNKKVLWYQLYHKFDILHHKEKEVSAIDPQLIADRKDLLNLLYMLFLDLYRVSSPNNSSYTNTQ